MNNTNKIISLIIGLTGTLLLTTSYATNPPVTFTIHNSTVYKLDLQTPIYDECYETKWVNAPGDSYTTIKPGGSKRITLTEIASCIDDGNSAGISITYHSYANQDDWCLMTLTGDYYDNPPKAQVKGNQNLACSCAQKDQDGNCKLPSLDVIIYSK